MKNKPNTGKFLLTLIIFMLTLVISNNSNNAFSAIFPMFTYSMCDTYPQCGLYGCLYGGIYGFYGFCNLAELPYTVTCKTCLKTGCTEEVCMTDLFQNPLSYFYEYPYGYHAFYLLKPTIFEIGKKTETMGTSEMCMPDMFIFGGEEKTDIISLPSTSMCISPDIFIGSEPAAPPAY